MKLFRWIPVLTLAFALASKTASAQEGDTLSISGSFRGYGGVTDINGIEYPGNCGADLAEVHAHNESHGWTLTLHGVSYTYDSYYDEWYDEWGGYGYQQQYTTRVHATSIDVQFVGPDADVLNDVVGAQLTGGSLPNGAVLELWNYDYFDSWVGGASYSSWDLGLTPGPDSGVSFYVGGDYTYDTQFATDESGYPLVEPQRLGAYYSTITDLRSGNSGGLASYDDLVDIGSTEPPYLPPIPPPPPTMIIGDGFMLEGDRRTTRLLLTVKLSRISDDPVSADYRTADGTATSPKDFTATNGTVIFLPGETERTIAISIKGDREREPNETFSLQLSNAVGATIDDGYAIATILNDD